MVIMWHAHCETATPQMKTMIQLKYLKKKKLDSWGEMRVNNLVQMNDCVNEPNIVYESGMRELGKKHCQIWHRRWVNCVKTWR